MTSDRRNPPPEFLISQIADLLTVSKDVLCIAAATIANDLQEIARTEPDKVEQAFKAFRRAVKDLLEGRLDQQTYDEQTMRLRGAL